jgi:AcrR family transcriptional regulator
MSTKAVAAAAGIQAPTIYRLFGDNEALLDAVAEYGFAAYLAAKPALFRPTPTPSRTFGQRGTCTSASGWPTQPVLAMYGDPRPGHRSPARVTAFQILQARIRSMAAAGHQRYRGGEFVETHKDDAIWELMYFGHARDQ